MDTVFADYLTRADLSKYAVINPNSRTISISFPPVFVYGFGAIFGKNTAIEPLKISRSVSDRVDYPPIRLSCFLLWCQKRFLWSGKFQTGNCLQAGKNLL